MLLADTPADLLPTVCYLCQGLIAPELAGIDLGVAEKLAVRAVAGAAGIGAAQVTAVVWEAGDLGQAAEQLLIPPAAGAGSQADGLEVAEVVRTLREIAVVCGQRGRSPLRTALPGSVSRTLAAHSRPVLIAPGKVL